MIPETYLPVIRKLIKLTREGLALWRTTSVIDQYSLKMKNGVVLFDRYFQDEPEESIYFSFSFMDNDGELIDEIEIYPGEGTYTQINSLFDFVERKFNKKIIAKQRLIDEIRESEVLGDDE